MKKRNLSTNFTLTNLFSGNLLVSDRKMNFLSLSLLLSISQFSRVLFNAVLYFALLTKYLIITFWACFSFSPSDLLLLQWSLMGQYMLLVALTAIIILSKRRIFHQPFILWFEVVDRSCDSLDWLLSFFLINPSTWVDLLSGGILVNCCATCESIWCVINPSYVVAADGKWQCHSSYEH